MKPTLPTAFLVVASLVMGDQVFAQISGYAAMGDSVTAGNNFNNSWVPHLSSTTGLDFGGAANPFNVAVGGAQSGSLLSQGQHTDVRDLVQTGDVDLPYIWIGGNDFRSVAFQIADGSLSGPALSAEIDGWISNIETAIDTVLPAGPSGMVVVGLPDFTLTPEGRALYDTPVEIARAQAAATEFNDKLLNATLDRSLTFVDTYGLTQELETLQPMSVGGVAIDFANAGSNPTHFFKDGIHPGRVGNGIIANMMLAASNIGYGTSP